VSTGRTFIEGYIYRYIVCANIIDNDRQIEGDSERGQPGFPFVEFVGGSVVLPVCVAQKEVNIVPSDLMWFVQHNRQRKASYVAWEGGSYPGALQVVPV
jgi:hypothetical protein